MRTVPTTTKQSNPDVEQAPAPRQLKCGQVHAYKLRTTTADATSPIYKLSVPFFDCGTPGEWMKFQRGLAAVLKSQNITQGPASYAVAKTLTQLSPSTQMNFLASWNSGFRQAGVGNLLFKDLIPLIKACTSLWSSVPA
eukprot:14174117-Ditylum_brightwellii.AAC.1